ADILQAGCPAVLVPFATGGETEQTDRARALEARGVACVLQEDDLGGAALALMIDRAMNNFRRPSWRPKLDGAETTALILLEEIASRRAALSAGR
ncbi:MAG: glycosyltransferase, partial [Parvibaculaceae bacterium]